jgi:hypothetical protein
MKAASLLTNIHILNPRVLSSLHLGHLNFRCSEPSLSDFHYALIHTTCDQLSPGADVGLTRVTPAPVVLLAGGTF